MRGPSTGRRDGSGAVTAAGVVAGLVGVAAWEGTIGQGTPTAHWSVLAMIAATLTLAVAAGRGRQRMTSSQWARRGARMVAGELTGHDRQPAPLAAGAVVWALLIAATIGWDLNSFVHQAHDLPTLSRVVGDLTGHQWGRALVFAGWLALGGYLAVGWRRPADQPAP